MNLTINKGGRRQRTVVGGRRREDNDCDIPDGRREAVGVGRCGVERRTFRNGIRYSIATANVNKNDDRGLHSHVTGDNNNNNNDDGDDDRISSEATQGKASAVEDKRLPNH